MDNIQYMCMLELHLEGGDRMLAVYTTRVHYVLSGRKNHNAHVSIFFNPFNFRCYCSKTIRLSGFFKTDFRQ